jgi:phosphoenolpyruvate carboxylase
LARSAVNKYYWVDTEGLAPALPKLPGHESINLVTEHPTSVRGTCARASQKTAQKILRKREGKEKGKEKKKKKEKKEVKEKEKPISCRLVL